MTFDLTVGKKAACSGVYGKLHIGHIILTFNIIYYIKGLLQSLLFLMVVLYWTSLTIKYLPGL